MSTYKNLLNAARAHFSSSTFLRGLLSAHLVIFAFGGAVYLLGAYLINLNEMSAFSWYDSLTSVGTVFAFTGLLLSILADDAMGIAIVSGVISVGALTAWIVIIASGQIPAFFFEPLFFFALFATVALVTGIKSDKFKQMRAAAAARAQMAVMPCPNCGAFAPMASAFCPACGAQKPPMQYAPPAYQPPMPQYAPPAPLKCASCGADVIPGAAFCLRCGAKQ